MDATPALSDAGAAAPVVALVTPDDIAVLRELSSRLVELIGEMRTALAAGAGDKGADR